MASAKNDVHSEIAVSIVIPVFNSAATLKRCITSVLEQNLSNLEVIIVDGQSSDRSLNIAANMLRKDKRIRLTSSPDSGVYDALNEGLRQASGDYIYFLGSDDILYDRFTLGTMYAIAASKPECALIYGNVKIIGDCAWANDGEIYAGAFDDVLIQQKNICHQAILYDREKIISHGGYDLRWKVCADWAVNMTLFARYPSFFVDRIVCLFAGGGISSTEEDDGFAVALPGLRDAAFGDRSIHAVQRH